MKITATLSGVSITATNGNGVTNSVVVKIEDFKRLMDAIKSVTKINKFNTDETL